MNHKLVVALLVTTFFYGAEGAEIKGKVLSYGIFGFQGEVQKVKTPGTPSGSVGVINGVPVLMTATNRIPAKIGVQFGMFYEISNLRNPNGVVMVTKICRHPPITRPDGTVWTHFAVTETPRVRDGWVFTWTGFTFDHPYELVPGKWEIEIEFKGKPICKQEFTVVMK